MTDPEWLAVGQPVAVAQYGNPERIKIAYVERMTATRVVLLGGEWFRRDRLEKSTGSGVWSNTVRLEDPYDPSVVQRLRIQQSRSLADQLYSRIRAASRDELLAQLGSLASLAGMLTRKLEALRDAATDEAADA